MINNRITLSTHEINHLESYLSIVFGRSYRRLTDRINRWALIVEPLNPEKYPKGNTKQFHRWELPNNPPSELAYLRGLYASEEECHVAKYRLMAQIVFMEDAPLLLG